MNQREARAEALLLLKLAALVERNAMAFVRKLLQIQVCGRQLRILLPPLQHRPSRHQ